MLLHSVLVKNHGEFVSTYILNAVFHRLRETFRRIFDYSPVMEICFSF